MLKASNVNGEATLRIFSKDNTELWRWSFLATAFWMLAAHICRWVNVTMANHDSLMIVQNDALLEVTLGRFLQPVFDLLRGNIASPLIIGIISIVFLSLTIGLTCKLLGFSSPWKITLLSGVLSTCYVFSLHNASYIFTFDISMEACFLGALASYLTARYRFGFIAAIPLFSSIFALSPGYITYSITLILLYLLRGVLQKQPPTTIVILGLKALCYIILGALLYLVVYPLVQDGLGVTASSYRNFSNLLQFNDISFKNVLLNAYLIPFRILSNPPVFGSALIGVINIALFVLCILVIIRLCMQQKLTVCQIVLLLFILILLPLAMNCAYIVASNAYHELFHFAFYLFYGLVLLTYSLASKKEEPLLTALQSGSICKKGATAVILVSFVAISFSGVVYANQIYVKKDLESQATLSVMTRIVDKVESLDEYEPGKTPVALVGDLRNNEPYSHTAFGFAAFQGNGLQTGAYSVTYSGTYRRYFRSILNEPISILPDAEIKKYSEMDSVKEMPIFPHEGYCAMLDGTAVIKLSDY